jgi:hypothetical protein
VATEVPAEAPTEAPAVVAASVGPVSADPTGQDPSGNNIVDPSWLPCQPGQIKGSQNGKYHVPDGRYYARTYRNVTCFNSTDEAEAAGFVRAQNQ